MTTQVYDVYKGLEDLVNGTFPQRFLVAHNGFDWGSGSLYYVGVKKAKISYSGLFYGVCMLHIAKGKVIGDKVEKEEVGKFPLSVVISGESDLHKDLMVLVNQGESVSEISGRLEPVWKKVVNYSPLNALTDCLKWEILGK